MDLHSSFVFEERAEDRRGKLRGGVRTNKPRYRTCTGRCGMCSMDGGSSQSRVALANKARKNYGAIRLDVSFSAGGTIEQLMFGNKVEWRKSVPASGY